MPERPIYYNDADYDDYVDYDARRPGASRRGSARRDSGRPERSEYREDVRGYERNRPQYGQSPAGGRRPASPRPGSLLLLC